MVELLINNGADIEARDAMFATPIHYADHTSTASTLLDHGAKIDTKDMYNDTRLCKAMPNGELEMAKLLLEKGADPNTNCYKSYTVLEWAIMDPNKGNTSMIELLLKNGANVNKTDNGLETPLHFAASYGKLEVVEALLEKGADVNFKSNSSWTALHFAAFGEVGEQAEVAKILIGHGAEIEAKDVQGRTALHYAAENGVKGLEVA